jgi:RNA polymerase sigma-B factor
VAELAGSATGSAPSRLSSTSLGAERDRRTRATASLWERIVSATSEDEQRRLRGDVVLLNMSVARSIASRYRSRGIVLDDLEQVACLGLVKAANGFDPGREKDFLSYAVPTISGEVKRHFRDLGWTVRPPRRVQELQARIHAVSDETAQSLGRPPHPSEMAVHLEVPVSDVIEALTCNGFSPMSLNVPLGESASSASLGDLLPSGGSDFDGVENAMVLRQALATLSPRDRLIIRRRFFDGHTQQQIGEEIGISQMQVSRHQARILARLRAVVESADSDSDLNLSA